MSDELRDRPILVTGLPRSGTSLVAGILATCGAWTGRTVPRGRSNPKGYFENVALREGVDKRLLREIGRDPLGVLDLPPAEELPLERAPALAAEVRACVAAEGYGGERPWLFKDPKLLLLWPLWHAAFPAARWVVVRREREDVVRSCLRTHFLVQHSRDPEFWRRFADAYLERLRALDASAAWTREAWPQALVRGERGALRELAGELDLGWDEGAVRRFVAPRHWHSR